jgi:hypothetical protein
VYISLQETLARGNSLLPTATLNEKELTVHYTVLYILWRKLADFLRHSRLESMINYVTTNSVGRNSNLILHGQRKSNDFRLKNYR